MTKVSLAATAAYLPERWMPAAEVAARSGIPEQVIVEKFGLRGKHIAAAGEHVSDLSVRAAETLLAETGFDPGELDVVLYYGSMWRDYSVWQVAPHIAYRIGATNAFALEFEARPFDRLHGICRLFRVVLHDESSTAFHHNVGTSLYSG